MAEPRDWLVAAEDDLKIAKSLKDDNLSSGVCFHSQQVAEKSLKAILLSKGQKSLKTHDLAFLLKRLGKEEHLDACEFLNRFYIPIRYPDAPAGSIEDRRPSTDMAIKALEYAQEIFDFAASQLKEEE